MRTNHKTDQYMKSLFVYPQDVFEPGLKFANGCAISIKDDLNKIGISIDEIIGCNATSKKVEKKLKNRKIKNFLAFGHGSEVHITVRDDGVPVFDLGQTLILKNKLCYFLSCCTGKTLGLQAIRDGAIAFIGFTEEFWFLSHYKDDFLECATSGIREFLLEKCDMKDIEKITRKRFDDKINELKSKKAYVAAGWFNYDISIMVFYFK